MCSRSFPATFLVILMVGLVGIVSACGSPTPPPTPIPTPTEPSRITPLPQPTATSAVAAEGETIMRTNCTTCHTLDRVVSAKKTREQWEQTVVRMIRLSAVEQPVLVDYLAKTYKP